jgi:hypothetical protein
MAVMATIVVVVVMVTMVMAMMIIRQRSLIVELDRECLARQTLARQTLCVNLNLLTPFILYG